MGIEYFKHKPGKWGWGMDNHGTVFRADRYGDDLPDPVNIKSYKITNQHWLNREIQLPTFKKCRIMYKNRNFRNMNTK
jgi:hypothetical protein